jgi:HAD superfamily hydrolase (TIGR01484 family)
MALRCVYTDLDGTLLGKGGSLLADHEGNFTTRAVRALEACHRASVEVVLCSGRSKAQMHQIARLIGQPSYIYELGGGLVVDGEVTLLTGAVELSDQGSVYRLIEDRGAVSHLLSSFGSLEHQHADSREITHLFRGTVDTAAVGRSLEQNGFDYLTFKDNGAVRSRSVAEHTHAYHLLPQGVSKHTAVAAHRRMRGYRLDECVAVGDSLADLEMCEAVASVFLVRNGIDSDPELEHAADRCQNAAVTEGSNGEGFYEAVVLSLQAAR